MIYTILACFIKRTISSASSSDDDDDQLKVASEAAVYRDDLIIKKPPPPVPSCKAAAAAVNKKSVRFADSEPAILGGGGAEYCDDDEKDLVKGRIINYGVDNNNNNYEAAVGEEIGVGGGIRVKVKMTKEEAARLLSKCKQGGKLDFKDVARELVALPINRLSVISATCTKNN